MAWHGIIPQYRNLRNNNLTLLHFFARMYDGSLENARYTMNHTDRMQYTRRKNEGRSTPLPPYRAKAWHAARFLPYVFHLYTYTYLRTTSITYGDLT